MQEQEVEVLNIDHFYKKFELEKRRYEPSLFCVGTPTKRKKKEPVKFSLYKKIVKEYLKVYFFYFYTNKDSVYFPLGGLMKKVVYPKWVRFMAKGKSPKRLSGGNNAIGLFWYMRPSRKMFFQVTIKKLTGKSNSLP